MSNGSCCVFEGDLLSHLLPPFLIVEFVLGSLGNGIALWGFGFHLKPWKSSTVYLFNLAVADFLLIICLPLRTDYYLRRSSWLYGDVPCRLVLFMLAMNRAGSISFLTLVAVDRYFRVVHPHHRLNSVSSRAAAGVACLIWLLTIAGTSYLLPSAHLAVDGQGSVHCDSFTVCAEQLLWHDLLFLLEFFLPLGVVLYCSSRIVWRLRRRRLDGRAGARTAVRFVAVVAVVFVLCFSPSVAARLHVLRLSARAAGCEALRSADCAFYITVNFTYINSALDPLVYYVSSPSFRAFYLKIFKVKAGSGRPEAAGHRSVSAAAGGARSTSRL
uniref:Hydroxycarboxylic acid receptor 1-like n=1 Tax=Geotrypetes seraphini TaxID=260995 RepID=A0A6P8RXN6_GEOSA|nr:hydroxycarboxylic acid receptor 1-like [Geotrypetes seraphini]XP_033810423.1 hydroxycarboxylic acid receptor 1-like [Geotrypetes seraphini]XP_033810424.1 hydroxycarboxylic acid receptor 1-like [Geotrypetes seraphini]XP_033810425.1 hydroxycarboxylic acid receptor 1-like [Geotrypetes seraphini]XP_033810426.1 hydroxycarboxylic acid receptor 1-like [Geotrypetes seraphini]XP_033810427.1 hydroxycarboxylic acid receptor 1-like [Geotrypetes seraphini]XP_033810428.1 hydroxycarboxylic acid receptor 